MSSRRINVQVGLPPEIVEQIKNQPDYLDPAPGRVGGVAHWVRELVYDRLSLQVVDPHEDQSERRSK